MGDVLTHGRVTSFVVEQMKLVASARTIPHDEYSHLELGNFITDVAQFRDPVAFHKAREDVRETATEKAGAAAGPAGVDPWANSMFGVQSGGPRHGWLPEFFRVLAYAFTHLVFDPDGLTKQAAESPHAGAAAAALVPLHPIDPAEVQRVLDARFDQYWPHDHVDFPPMRYGPRHKEEPLFEPYKSGLIAYLDVYLQYLSEELSKLEFKWVSATLTTVTPQNRRDFLAQLGNLLHAVEDCFFHSNLAEVRQFQLLRRKFRDADPATEAGRKLLFENGMHGTRLNPISVHLRRILFRRLRYPLFVPNSKPREPWELSRRASEDGTALLFTGGFGGTDVFHTLGGALEAMEKLAPALRPENPAESHLVLVRMTFNEQARREIRGRPKALEALLEQHAAQLVADEYPTSIDALHARGKLSDRAAERLKQAFAMDRRGEEQYKYLPGPGGVLLNVLDQLQTERTNNELLVDLLDGEPESITAERSQNAASSENVGTHSLMSKDSPSKEPFRDDAVVLAAHASAGVATALARRLESRAPITQGVDWDAVLRFFVRFPKHPSRRWEEQLIGTLRAAGEDFEQPDVDELAEQPRFPLLGPRAGADKLAKRRAGKRRQELEDYYRSFESKPPA